MSELLTQCGSERCSIEQLLAIPEPEKTETYTPLNHYDFAVNVKTDASNMLRDFKFAKQSMHSALTAIRCLASYRIAVNPHKMAIPCAFQ